MRCLLHRANATQFNKLYRRALNVTKLVNLQQGCGVEGKISNSDLSKISDFDFTLRPFQNFDSVSGLRLLNINGMKFGCWNQWKSWCTAKNLCFNKSFKRNCTILTGIPNLRVWCKKWSNWTFGVAVGQQNPTSTSSVVRNPTPPINLRLLAAPTPQPSVCRHLQADPDHRVDFHNPEVIGSDHNWRRLQILESLLFQEHNPQLNANIPSMPLCILTFNRASCLTRDVTRHHHRHVSSWVMWLRMIQWRIQTRSLAG